MEAEPRTATAVQMPLLLCSQKLQGNGNAGWKKVSLHHFSVDQVMCEEKKKKRGGMAEGSL